MRFDLRAACHCRDYENETIKNRIARMAATGVMHHRSARLRDIAFNPMLTAK
jgi:hypothetical protein